MRIPWNTLTPSVVLVLMTIQISSVLSAKCDPTNMDDCCKATLTCPLGYYKAQNCPTTPSMVSLTTIQMTTRRSGTTNNSGNTTGTNTTVGSTSESTTVGSTTGPSPGPSLGSSPISSPGSSPTSSTDDAETNGNSTSTLSNDVVCRRCPDGCTECTASGNCTNAPPTQFPVVVVAAGVSGGVVFVVVVVVITLCIIKRRRREDCENPASAMDDVLNGRKDIKPAEVSDICESPKVTEPGYANIASRPENLALNIQQGQDKIFRYVKDPTDHTETRHEEPLYENHMTIKVKHCEDENHEIDALGVAPAPPGPPAAPPEETETSESEQIYYNEVPAVKASSSATRSVRHSAETGINEHDNDEEQLYENEAAVMGDGDNASDTSTYVNYAFHKDQ